MMRRSVWAAAAVALLGAAMAMPPSAARADLSALDLFAGRYTFAGGARERSQLEDAIDDVVDRLNVFIREIARGEIRRNVRPEPRIALEVIDGRRVRVSFGDWGPLDLRLDGPARRTRGPDGSDTAVRASLRGRRLLVTQRSSRGERDNWLSVSRDGEWLYNQVRIGADQLPADIRYTLSYRRR